MQIVSNGDNLHEMSKPVFLEIRKIINASSAELESGKVNTEKGPLCIDYRNLSWVSVHKKKTY